MKQILPLSNKTLIYIISITLAIVLIGTLSNLSKLSLSSAITGANVVTGNASITINTVAQINMTLTNISWGPGTVTSGQTRAQLDTRAGTVTNGNWTAVSTGFIFENIGNVDINLTVLDYANTTAASLIGGTNPALNYTLSENEGDACASNGGALAPNWQVNFTGLNRTILCSNFSYVDSKDQLRFDVNLTIPSDSTTGYKQLIWIFEGIQSV